MTNVKNTNLRNITLILVFVCVVIAIISIINENFFYVAHDSETHIEVWLDTNGDGKHDNDEPFLPNVCVWGGYASEFQLLGGWEKICEGQFFLTDSVGKWYAFFANRKCKEIYNAINPPENYFPTTPTIVKGCSAKFGLSQEKTSFEVPSQDGGLYLQKENQKVPLIFRIIIGTIILLIITIYVGFIIHSITAKNRY